MSALKCAARQVERLSNLSSIDTRFAKGLRESERRGPSRVESSRVWSSSLCVTRYPGIELQASPSRALRILISRRGDNSRAQD